MSCQGGERRTVWTLGRQLGGNTTMSYRGDRLCWWRDELPRWRPVAQRWQQWRWHTMSLWPAPLFLIGPYNIPCCWYAERVCCT